MTDYHPEYTNSIALLVGINSYKDPHFVALGSAEDDARRLAQTLTQPSYGFQTTLLLGAEATKVAILDALFELHATLPDDRVLVYFAGHGYTLTDNFGYETGYLAASDTLAERHHTALELEEVTDLRRHATAKHISFVFDACFSGQALGLTRTPSVAAGSFMTRRAYQVISAGAGDQTVGDFHSMTDLLVDVLESDLSREGNLYTVSQLGLYLQQTMAADSKQQQIPQFGHLKGSQGGDFVLYAAPDKPPEPETKPRADSHMEPMLVSQKPRINRLWIVSGILVLAMIVIGILALLGTFRPADGPEQAQTEPATEEDVQVIDDSVTRTPAVLAETGRGRIAFDSDRDGSSEIYLMDEDGSNVTRLTENPASDFAPAWSPDASRIAFVSSRDGNFELYTMNADGSDPIRLTDHTADDLYPAWSPDGSQIAFASDRDGNFEVYVIDANGSNLVRLTDSGGDDVVPAWSPDGTRIAFASQRDGNFEIYVMDAAGSDVVRLTNDLASDSAPAWSPDGTQIAFYSRRDNNAEIYLIGASGSNLLRLTDDEADDLFPTWSPDGLRIAFESNRDGNSEIYVMDANGGNLVRLTLSGAEDLTPAWSP